MEPKYLNNGGKSERRSQVTEKVELLEKGIAHLMEVRGSLEQRLSAILIPAIPESTKADKPPRPQLVELAEKLDSIVGMVDALQESMTHMLERIEL